ncbi:MAG: murein transglycosylase A [Candidatus Eiseniibacteriota bacterium]
MRRTARTRRRPSRAIPARVGLALALGAWGAFLGLTLYACTSTPPAAPAASYRPSEFADLPGWDADRQAEALPALRRSCAQLDKLPDDKPVGATPFGAPAGRVADWRPACKALAALHTDDAQARAYFERWFRPIEVSKGDGSAGLFTAYYEPELRGSKQRHGRYTVPLYGRPADLVVLPDKSVGRRIGGKVEPYPTRAEIDGGQVQPPPPVLLWLDDPVDAYVLQVQGSGRVRLAEGGSTNVGVAATNGRPYVSIGRLLVQRGQLTVEGASMQSIRAWLRANPAAGRALINENPRYVFFRETGVVGAVGAQGVPLTAGRSLAVDPAFVPLGAPVWLDTAWPGQPARPLRRLMVAQDTGGAIKGAARGDVFWGVGEAALTEAGRMHEAGRYYVLVPREAALRIATR